MSYFFPFFLRLSIYTSHPVYQGPLEGSVLFCGNFPPVPYPRHPSSLCCASTPSLTFSLQGIVVEQHVGQQVGICFLRQLFCCATISSASVVVSPPGVTEVQKLYKCEVKVKSGVQGTVLGPRYKVQSWDQVTIWGPRYSLGTKEQQGYNYKISVEKAADQFWECNVQAEDSELFCFDFSSFLYQLKSQLIQSVAVVVALMPTRFFCHH